MLLVTSAVVMGGCSADASRFGDFYANALPAGAAPAGLDDRATASIGSARALVPGAPVAPQRMGPGYQIAATNPAPVARGWTPPRAAAPIKALDMTSTGSIGSVARAPLAPLRPAATANTGPVPLPPANAVGATIATAAANRSRSIADRVRDVLPSVPRANPAPRRVAAAELPRTPALDRVVTAGERKGGWNGSGGTSVTVGEGETLYNLSKRYGVPVAAIMQANGIADPTTVRLGQTLAIPTYTYSRSASVSAPDSDPLVRSSAASTGMLGEVAPTSVPSPALRPSRAVALLRSEPAARAAVPSAAGTVQVRSGDTLYSLARRAGTTVEALRAANGMSTNAIAIGQTLRLPNAAAPARIDRTITASIPREAASTATRRPVVPALPRVTRQAAPVQPKGVEPASEPVQLATAPASVPERSSAGRLRWPVKGRVIESFGGERKGVDIAVPPGSPVRAAENGTVIYAGSGLKQFGKTVLVQHANGLVTVYGHADTLNVAKGQKVARGDVIASSGMTGNAASPRVHFQVRKGSTPVDPSGYLN